MSVASCASQSATGRPQGGNGQTNCRADWAKRDAGASGRLVVGAGVVVVHFAVPCRQRRLPNHTGPHRAAGRHARQAPPFPGGPSRGEQASSRAFNRREIGEDRYLCDGGGGCHWTELGVQRCALLEQQTKQAVWLGGSYSWEPSMAARQWTASTGAAGARRGLCCHAVLACAPCCRRRPPRGPPHSSFLSELLSAGLAGVWRGIFAITWSRREWAGRGGRTGELAPERPESRGPGHRWNAASLEGGLVARCHYTATHLTWLGSHAILCTRAQTTSRQMCLVDHRHCTSALKQRGRSFHSQHKQERPKAHLGEVLVVQRRDLRARLVQRAVNLVLLQLVHLGGWGGGEGEQIGGAGWLGGMCSGCKRRRPC